MSKKTYNIKPLGLNTNSNPIALPRGAMVKALDVSLTRPGILESRPAYVTNSLATSSGATGYDCPTYPGPGGNGVAYQPGTTYTAAAGKWVSFFPNYPVTDSGGNTVTRIYPDASTETLSSGPLTSSFAASQNDYILGQSVVPYLGTPNSAGVLGSVVRVDGAGTASPTCRAGGAGQSDALTPAYLASAGAVTSVAGVTIASTTPLSNQLSSTTQTAYRVLFAHKDGKKNLVRGAPSGRLIVYGPTNNYLLFIPLPVFTYAGDILQVYRSEIVPTGSNEPSDEMRQVWEYIVQSTDVTNGYVVWANDKTPDSIRGPALYTNDSQQGILQAEARPPNCSFGKFFKNVAWYGGVAFKNQTILLSILGVDQWVVGTTTFTITNSRYSFSKTVTAAAAENLTAGQFLLDTTSGTAALKLFNTARSLCRALSWQNKAVSATYITGANDISAQILVKTNLISDEDVNTIVSNAAAGTISPNISSSTTLTVGGRNNYLYYSKPNQPEAVPDVNYVTIGAPGSGIVGMETLGDSLFVFKQEGLFRVTGNTADTIRVELFDPTVRLQPGGWRSIGSGGNQIFCVCNQGVVSITESGCNVISTPIDNIIKPYKSAANYGSSSPLAPYPCSGAVSISTQEYFLLLTDTFSNTTTQRLMIYNLQDGMWYEWTPANSTYTTGVAFLNNVTFADRIVQTGTAAFNYKTYLPNFPGSISYAPTPTFTYCMDSGEAPDVLQRFESVKLITIDSSSLGAFTFTFSSDSGAAPVSMTVTNGAAPGVVRCDVPRDHAVCGQLTVQVSCASGHLIVYGMIISYNNVSDWMDSRNNA